MKAFQHLDEERDGEAEAEEVFIIFKENILLTQMEAWQLMMLNTTVNQKEGSVKAEGEEWEGGDWMRLAKFATLKAKQTTYVMIEEIINESISGF